MSVRHITEKGLSRLLAIEMRFIRAINGKTRYDRIMNDELRKGIVKGRVRQKGQKTRL